MKKAYVIAALALVQPAMAQVPASSTTDIQTHSQLRAMKDRLVAAVNDRKVEALLAEVDPQVRMTTMDSVLSKGPDGVRAYYEKMMTGSTRLVEDMKLSAEPDDLSLLYGDNRIAVSTGTAKAHFRLVGGKEMDVPLRWTATSVNRDGQWKVASAQFGADMFDNPVLSAANGFAKYLAAGTGVAGLFLGWLLGRRRRTA